MLKPKKIIQILSAFALIALLWISFIVIQSLFERRNSHHEQFIPSDAESVLEIDGERIIRDFMQEIVLEKRWEGDVPNLKDLSSSDDSYGFDYRAKFYVYTLKKGNHKLTGILANVIDEEQFKKTFTKFRENGIGFSVKDGVGMILIDDEKRPLGIEKLCILSEDYLKETSMFDLSLLTSTLENSKISFWRKVLPIENGSNHLSDLKLSLRIDGNEIEMNGNALFKTSNFNSYPALKKKDLSFQSTLIPKEMNKVWVKYTKILGFSLPELRYISGNYHYAEPSNIPELAILPNFDGIYSFEKNFRIEIPLIASAASGKISGLNLRSFEFGGKTMYYKQINPKTIYLGQTPFSGTISSGDVLFDISGDLKRILDIQNGGIMTKFLALSKEYSAAKRLIDGIEASNLSMTRDGDTKVKLDAKILFNEDKSALNELLMVLLSSGVLD